MIDDTIYGMAETPPNGPSYGQGASGFPGAPGQFPSVPGGPPSWPSSAPRGASRLLTFISLGISVIATVLAMVGWFRPTHTSAPATSPSGSPTYTQQQIADAKARICAALDLVHKGTMLHAGTNVGQSSDPAMAEAEGADARLAIISGAWYLRDHLDPAAPQAISDEIKQLADTMLDLGANYLADARNDDPAQSALIKKGNSGFDRALELCK